MKKVLLLLLLWTAPVLAQTNAARMVSGVKYVAACPYTFLNSDVTKLVTFTAIGPCSVTLPGASAPGFTAGSIFSVANNGTGFVTITPVAGTIFGKASLQLAPGQGVDIYSDGTNYGLQPGAGSGGSGSGFPITTPVAINAGGSITVNSGGSIGTAGSGIIAATTATSAGTAANLSGCLGSTNGDICYWNGSAWTRLPGNGSGTTFLQETPAGVPSWGNPPGGGTVNNGIGGHFTWYASSGNVVDSNTHLDDSATTSNTINSSENIAAPQFVGNGPGATSIGFAQGTPDNCPTIQASAPLNIANSYCIGAPTSITTTYEELIPATPSTGFRFGTYAAPVITDSIVPSVGSGSVVLSSGITGTGNVLQVSGTTGTGNAVLATSPTLVTPALGTPSALVLTNASGLPCSALPALVGDTTTSAGSCTTATSKINGAAVPTSAPILGSNAGNQLVGAVTTGSGSTVVLATSPTIATPVLNTSVSGSALQGTDTKLLSAGTVTGTSVLLCTDANGGATTSSCPNAPAASITSSGMAWWFGGYSSEPSVSTGMAVGSNNEVRACGFILPFTTKTTTVYYDITAQGTGNFDIGLYNSSGSLVMHIGATAVPATGIHSATVVSSPVTLSPGFYYAAFTFSSSATNQIVDWSPNSPGSYNASAPALCGVAANAATAGALPATMGAITANGNVGIVAVKAAP